MLTCFGVLKGSKFSRNQKKCGESLWECWTMQLGVVGIILLANPAHFSCACLLVFPHFRPPEGFPCSLRCLGGQWGKARSNHTSPFISASWLLLQGQLCYHVFPHLGLLHAPLSLSAGFFHCIVGNILRFWHCSGSLQTASETASEIVK